MFEKATRLKLRFDYKGLCSVEELWDLKVQDLDRLYKILNKVLKEESEDSLLETKTKDSGILELKINIIKHIVTIKLEEKRLNELKLINSEKKQKILRLISEKQDENLKSMDIDELNKLIEGLD